jgi:hypothetical protein
MKWLTFYIPFILDRIHGLMYTAYHPIKYQQFSLQQYKDIYALLYRLLSLKPNVFYWNRQFFLGAGILQKPMFSTEFPMLVKYIFKVLFQKLKT